MRFLLAFFFFFMYMGDDLGLNISLGPGMSTKNVLLYVILVGIAIDAAVARNRNFDLPSITVPFALLVVYAVMTWITLAFIIAEPGYSLRLSFITLKSSLVDQLITFLIYFYGVLHLRDSLWLLKTIVWIVIVGNLITIIDTFNVPNLGILDVPRKAGRFQGFLGQPNSYGQFLVLFIPATIVLYLRHSGKLRWMAGIGVFTSILALILSGSRGAYVGLIAGSAFAAFVLRRDLPRFLIARAVVISLVVCCVAIWITFVTGYADIWVERTLSFEGSAHVITHGRTTIWLTALQPMLEQPFAFLTGFGFLSYESGLYRKSMHSVYLSFLYNLGIIGLGLFLAVFFRILVTARTALRNVVGVARSNLVAVIFGLSSFMAAMAFAEYQSAGYLLWAYLGIGMRLAVQVMPVASPLSRQSERIGPTPIGADRAASIRPDYRRPPAR